MTSSIDVLGLGVAAIDDLLYVNSFPRPDQVMRIVRRERQCGGLTATALVAASRLGSAAAYAGVLGEDSDSEFVTERMRAMKVDLTHLVHKSGARPIRSTIIVDESSSTRTILCDLNGVVGAAPDRPEESVIRSARVLFVDNFGVTGMIRAARIARMAGIPVVGDFSQAGSQDIEEILSLCDHPILSLDFARGVTSVQTPVDILKVLWNEDRNTVVVTAGAEGAWALSREGIESECHYSAFRVETVDTTGCGDVFHGAYASALARGMNVHERIRFASAGRRNQGNDSGGTGRHPKPGDGRRFPWNSN